jgi:CPA2 family monovalent cation:H+ antiporter-2
MTEVLPGGYSNVVAFLATAGVVGPLFARLKISPILGFLAAGVALGPQGLGQFVAAQPWLDYFTVSKPEQIAGLAELGVVFLLFTIGLELSFERLRLMRRWVFGLGALQSVASGALIAAVAMALGLPREAAFALGAALALSSTAVVLPVMAEGGRLHSASGRAVFSVLLFQDLAVAPILIALAFLAGPSASGPNPLLALGVGVAGLVGVALIGRLLLRPLFASAASASHREYFIAAALLLVIGAGLAARMLGLSMALGALVAGLLLAETEFRHEVEVLIGPFKDLLLGLFFLSVGLNLNVALILASPVSIFAAAAALLAVKGVAATAAARAFGLKGGAALECGLVLAAGGEFAFVIIGQAQGRGLLEPALAQALTVSATLTMFAIPALGALGARLGRAPVGVEAVIAPPPEPDERPRVLLIGYGRVGRLVGDMLDRHKVAWVAVDRSVRSVGAGRANGREVYFGDASSAEFLERCGLMTAPGVVLTTDEPEAAEAVVQTVRRLRPDVVLVARARDARHARRLYELGASDAVPETIEASLQLSEAVLVDIGVPMGLVIASIHEKRDEIRTELSQAKAGAG